MSITINVKDKKNILLVVRWPGGGIGNFIRYVYSSFEPDKYQFTIVAPDLPELIVLKHELSGLGFQYCVVPALPSIYEIFIAVTKLLFTREFDLVHSHGFTSSICSLAAAKLLTVPHILTSHDTFSPTQFLGMRGKIQKALLGITLCLVDKIHLVSHDAYDNLNTFFPKVCARKRKCQVILNGVQTEIFLNANPRNLRGELGLDDKTMLIGFLGRFMSLKGFCYLVDAIDHLNRTRGFTKKTMVVAFGEGGFIREEKLLLEQRGLRSFFTFLPSTSDVAAAIKGLDVVVMPSVSETCPLLPMEVLTCGIPLIASDCIGLREVVQGTPALMFKSRDSVALANEIKKTSEVDLRPSFEAFALKAAERFDVKKTVEGIKVMYKQIL